MHALHKNEMVFADLVGQRFHRNIGGEYHLDSQERDASQFWGSSVLIFAHANAKRCLFNRCTLRSVGHWAMTEEPWKRVNCVDFSDTGMVNCRFDAAKLVMLDLINAVLVGCVFDKCKLERANFTGGHYRDCEFNGVAFKDCIFAASRKAYSSARGVFKNCTFRNCTFTHGQAHRAIFDGCTFIECSFDKLSVGHFTFHGNTLTGTKLFNPELKNPLREGWRGRRLERLPAVVELKNHREKGGYQLLQVSVVASYCDALENKPERVDVAIRDADTNVTYFTEVCNGIRNRSLFGGNPDLLPRLEAAIDTAYTEFCNTGCSPT